MLAREGRRRARVARVLRHTLLGLVMTILTGLLCAAHSWDRTYRTHEVWSSSTPASRWPGPVPPSWPPTPEAGTDIGFARSFEIGWGMLSHSVQVLTYTGPQRDDAYTYDVLVFGFPFPSLRFDLVRQTPLIAGASHVYGRGYNEAQMPWCGLRLARGAPVPSCVLPLIPYWRGLVPNVLFWTGVSVLVHRLYRIAKRLRSTRRLARGLCPTCRYPIDTTPVCPECGTSLWHAVRKSHADHTRPA